ncbi:TadE family type IV pilus minor pilin [Mycetocola zhujimingii]|uniref:TadE family type IV pilus minor pilin n=1 Tax=Mycetocola zhujimingii TaxID=2079792 RepID=UPI001E307479|nr:TadE family type IV pilus minor pilin [Mycetocola zhujimingii]
MTTVTSWARAAHRVGADAGSVTAEFAVALPAVILVLAGCLGAVQVASQQVRLADAAADAARTLARGDSVEVASARVSRVAGAAAMTTSTSGDFVCVELSVPAGIGPTALAGIRIRASGCALAGGL